MEAQIAQLKKDVARLKLYAAIITLIFFSFILYSFNQKERPAPFKEINAERINIVEPNGQLRMVIANKERSPEVLTHGKGYQPPIPGHNRPGIIFYNDEGTENGGLVFSGKSDSNGHYYASGHFSFDQYNQNQVLYLQYGDENGERSTGLHVDDWQESPPFWEWRRQYREAQKLAPGAEKEALLKRLMEPTPGNPAYAQRVFVGRNTEKAAVLLLSDKAGNPRLRLLVDSTGAARIDFLDEAGRATYSLPDRR
ncbi:hypothetical protein [Taibaiella koreensis]|uniref:hypothetical protein n=1 Tax=Taibaiella koreensis TaxID=1268548 RepID=UPI000E59BC17|nr:hypothetical protein [Taibaiella koreensis]